MGEHTLLTTLMNRNRFQKGVGWHRAPFAGNRVGAPSNILSAINQEMEDNKLRS